MGIDVVVWDGFIVMVEVFLELNLNIYGIVFGGSLYCVGVMIGWSLVYLILMDVGYLFSVWVVKGEVEYLKLVWGVLWVSIMVIGVMCDMFISVYESKGCVKINIEIVIQEEGQDVVCMKVMYVVMFLIE